MILCLIVFYGHTEACSSCSDSFYRENIQRLLKVRLRNIKCQHNHFNFIVFLISTVFWPKGEKKRVNTGGNQRRFLVSDCHCRTCFLFGNFVGITKADCDAFLMSVTEEASNKKP